MDIGAFSPPSLIKNVSHVVSSKDSKDLELAAVNFEQMFIKKILSSSRATLPGDQLLGANEQRAIMQDMQDDVISKELATSKSFGIADLLIKQAQLNKKK